MLAAAAILLAQPSAPGIGELRRPPTSYPVDLTDGDVVGRAGAPVVMQLYSDFQCPACRLFVTVQLPRLLTEFVLPGTLRIEAYDIAFLGQGARDESLELAAAASCAAEQDRYWTLHDVIFWNQGRENRGDHSEAFVTQAAAAAGLDPTAFGACLARDDVRPAITAATSAAHAQGITSTPTLLVNGEAIIGVPDYEELADLIRQQMAPAAP